MRGWKAQCPGCGAPVVFGLGTSLLRVCDQCRSAVVRRGVNLENHGKVAGLIPTTAVLALGLEGRLEDEGSFRIVGRAQLDHGSGAWDEWYAELKGDRGAWIAEAQGKIWVTFPIEPVPPIAGFDTQSPGNMIDLGSHGNWVVAERKSARFVSGEGELPFDVEPGATLNYVDLAGPRARVGTLDFGSDDQVQAVYLGREVRLPELGIDPKLLPQDDEVQARATASSLQCPNCRGALELRAPDQTRRVGCPYCGSLLDATDNLAVLAIAKNVIQPEITLGSRGRLHDVEWTVIGHLLRSVKVDGVDYPWQEHLLYEPKHGFRWLVLSNGHWSFVEPLNVAEVVTGYRAASLRGTTFKHFQGGDAVVDQVLGECYWEVAVGDSVRSDDYVAPPLMLSSETDAQEINWSLCTYTEPEIIQRAFESESASRPYGVAPNQPNPHRKPANSASIVGVLATLAVLVVFLALTITSRDLLSQGFGVPEADRPTGRSESIVSETFDVPRRSNVRLTLDAPVSNSWLFVSGALINEVNGDAYPFGVEVSYWHGRSGGESWNEGSRRRSTDLPAVPAGTYVLVAEPQFSQKNPPPKWNVRVRSGVPRLRYLITALIAVMIWPLFLIFRSVRFETERWSESDYAGSDDDE